MILIEQIKLPVTCDEQDIKAAAASKLHIAPEKIIDFKIIKRSVDARKKPDNFYVLSVAVSLSEKEEKVLGKFKKDNSILNYNPVKYAFPSCQAAAKSPVVVGAGPAGLFCALILARAGLNPIILERGKSVEQRTKDVLEFWNTGILNTKSNVQFGEGGAGTFSDGKLNTVVKDKFGRNRFVLETFVKHGASADILIDNKPHIGTDTLYNVIISLRKEIEGLGGQFRFESQAEDFVFEKGRVSGLMVNGSLLECEQVVLAVGHSARDTFYKLHARGVYMEAKDFAVGFRVEHPQNMISYSQYGESFKLLPPAAYKLTDNLSNGRGVYSFCMCPGGHVVNASSEENRLVVNGMSYTKRDSSNANSAIVVSVGSREYDKSMPLSAIEYQRHIEEKAYELCNGKIPQQLLGDFIANKISSDYGDFGSVTQGKSELSNLRGIYSEDINNSLLTAFSDFGRKIKGFDRYDAILSGVESRTSSPVRISRDDRFMSNYEGLYPCGEGAGYAGGIMSAAMDGIKVAEALIENLNK